MKDFGYNTKYQFKAKPEGPPAQKAMFSKPVLNSVTQKHPQTGQEMLAYLPSQQLCQSSLVPLMRQSKLCHKQQLAPGDLNFSVMALERGAGRPKNIEPRLWRHHRQMVESISFEN